MPDYKNGKIYKLCGGGLTYIGSTTQSLSQRLAQHRCNFKRFKEGKGVCPNYSVLEDDECQITLIEDCPCERKEQLLMRERFWIENIPCINITHPLRTPQEHHRDNKESINERHRKNYHNNIEREHERNKLYYYTNKEKEKERKAKYYQENKAKVIQRCMLYRNSKKYVCDCGETVVGKKYEMNRHFKTSTHLKYLQSIYI